ncbi:hypothetical protein [Psychrobacter sp. TAE2020]|uniref:hypothetical protein n=1 Tax=Psychrobacter sp. TAE2020 TaxID=2846762 RepID=UPI002B496077|nr:hypothetical protein [Psychrobacter sp. TAE2020]
MSALLPSKYSTPTNKLVSVIYQRSSYQLIAVCLILFITFSAQALPVAVGAPSAQPAIVTDIATEANTEQPTGEAATIDNTLAAQLKPSNQALSAANQKLLSQNAQLQRQVNDLQTQTNVLVYESKGQLFLYGAFTVLISLLVGIFVSWLVFVRRERW